MKNRKRDLRALVIMKILYQWMQEHQDEKGNPIPPKRRELMPEREPSLFTSELKRLGIPDLYGIQHTPQFVDIVQELRQHGLMLKPKRIPKAERNTDVDNPHTHRRVPYLLTPAGIEVAQTLGDDWREWPAFSELSKE